MGQSRVRNAAMRNKKTTVFSVSVLSNFPSHQVALDPNCVQFGALISPNAHQSNGAKGKILDEIKIIRQS